MTHVVCGLEVEPGVQLASTAPFGESAHLLEFGTIRAKPPADECSALGPSARPCDVGRTIQLLRAEGLGSIQLLCHDKRDLAFASSFGDIPYILPDDVLDHLDLLRRAQLVITFCLDPFIPCLSRPHAVNLSYDERSMSLVRMLGLQEWEIDLLREPDVPAAILDRVRRSRDLDAMISRARPLWNALERTTREAVARFVAEVQASAAQ